MKTKHFAPSLTVGVSTPWREPVNHPSRKRSLGDIKTMFCSGCGTRSDGSERFCRKCGANLPGVAIARGRGKAMQDLNSRGDLSGADHDDPDILTGNGVASVFVGDGFFFAAIFLSVLNSSVSSPLWLLLLIPAFFFFGKGFRDVWRARQIRRRLKQDEGAAPELEAGASWSAAIKSGSGQLSSRPSVTERTTRQLQ